MKENERPIPALFYTASRRHGPTNTTNGSKKASRQTSLKTLISRAIHCHTVRGSIYWLPVPLPCSLRRDSASPWGRLAGNKYPVTATVTVGVTVVFCLPTSLKLTPPNFLDPTGSKCFTTDAGPSLHQRFPQFSSEGRCCCTALSA